MFKAEADKLLRDVDPMMRVADGVLEDAPDADERVAKMLAIVDTKLKTATSKNTNRRKAIEWLDTATAAIAKLVKTPTDELKTVLADVQARNFPELSAPVPGDGAPGHEQV